MPRLAALVFAFILLFPALAPSGALAGGETMELALTDGVLQVLENNLDIVVQRIFPEIDAARVAKEAGAFDPSVFASFERRDSTFPFNARSSVSAGGRSGVESEVYSLEAGLTRRTGAGTEYSLEFSDTATSNTFNDFDFEYDAFAGVEVTQPLLKDYGPDANRVGILLASKDREISLTRLAEKTLDTVAGFELAYWDLVLARQGLGVKMESLRLAEDLLDLSRTKYEAEVISKLDLTQAKAGVASRREAVITARSDVWERENEVKLFITADVFKLSGVEIIPGDEPVRPGPSSPELASSVAKALQVRPDYLEARRAIEKTEIEIKYASNQKYPEVDLKASLGFNGFGEGAGSSLGDLDDNPTWTVGVVFNYPLGNRGAEANLKIARLEARQALISLKRLEQEIIVSLDNAIKDLGSNRERFEAAGVSTALAEDSLEAEVVKLDSGLSTAHDVLEFQEELEEARLVEISALIDYTKARTVLLREEGTLLEQRGIRIAGP
jgi:outer membrane protein TolC